MLDADPHYYLAGYSAESDPYVAPNGVLINLLGITSTAELNSVEDRLAILAATSLADQPIRGCFDLQHLSAIHRHLFGKVYPWAGKLRQVDIGKGDTMFLPHHQIEQAAASLFSGLRAEGYLKGLDAPRFCGRAAVYLGELNIIHPFREGNGRTQREFLRELAAQAGYNISWAGCSPDAMIRACIAARDGVYAPLAKLIEIGLSTLQREMLPDDDCSDPSPP